MKPEQFPAEIQNRPLWDAIVIGAGPSGATLATALANRGFSVVLLDKSSFPRHKVCGCCVSPMSAFILNELGLSESITARDPNRLTRLDLRTPGSRAVLPLPEGGFAISRKSLDDLMIKKARESGVVFLDGTTARPCSDSESDYSEVKITRSNESLTLRGRLTILASGLHGFGAEQKTVIARGSYLGAGSRLKSHSGHYAPGTIYMALTSSGYTGMVLLEDGSLNVASAVSSTLLGRYVRLDDAIRSILLASGFTVPFEENQIFDSTPLLSRKSSLTSSRLFSVGDNARFVEPFTGEGIGWAMLSSFAALPAIERILNSPEQIRLTGHIGKCQKLLWPYHLRCLLLTRAFRSELAISTAMKTLKLFPCGARHASMLTCYFSPQKIKELVRHVH